MDFLENGKGAADSFKVTSVFIQDSLIKWEYNKFLYNKALSKFGDDSDKEIQKLLSDFKAKVEQAELSFQNTPHLLDGGIRINPNY